MVMIEFGLIENDSEKQARVNESTTGYAYLYVVRDDKARVAT